MNAKDLEPKLMDAAEMMGLLAQPMRLRVLCALLDGERSVHDLAELCGLSQPAMSHHLGKLRSAGLVRTRREAQSIFYSIGSEAVRAILETLHGIYCGDEERAENIEKSAQVAVS